MQNKTPSPSWECRMAVTNEDMEIIMSSWNLPQDITLCPAWFLIFCFLVLSLSNCNELALSGKKNFNWAWCLHQMASSQVCRAVSWLMIDVGRLNSLGGCVALGQLVFSGKGRQTEKTMCSKSASSSSLCYWFQCLPWIPALPSLCDRLSTNCKLK